MEQVAAEVRDRSDEPPDLYLLYVSGDEVRLSPFNIPTSIWEAAPPPAVLGMLTERVEMFSELLPLAAAKDDLYGYAFRSSGWALQDDDADPGTVSRHAEAARERRVSEQPDAVRVAVISAVDREGFTYTAMRWGDSGEVETNVEPPEQTAADDGTFGVVPEALDRLVSATLGVSIPSRPAEPGAPTGLFCPGCGKPAAVSLGDQAFCRTQGCEWFSWDPHLTAEECRRDARLIDIPGRGDRGE
ncbi:MAG: hypothetical protein FWE35_10855 [Streptosporangiales bacterium]|nr:hypothetical protein [Streptosporangiales bacterium]